LKRVSSHLAKHKVPSREANPEPRTWLPCKLWLLGTYPECCWLNDKVTALFELRHARRDGRISFNTGRSI